MGARDRGRSERVAALPAGRVVARSTGPRRLPARSVDRLRTGRSDGADIQIVLDTSRNVFEDSDGRDWEKAVSIVASIAAALVDNEGRASVALGLGKVQEIDTPASLTLCSIVGPTPAERARSLWAAFSVACVPNAGRHAAVGGDHAGRLCAVGVGASQLAGAPVSLGRRPSPRQAAAGAARRARGVGLRSGSRTTPQSLGGSGLWSLNGKRSTPCGF